MPNRRFGPRSDPPWGAEVGCLVALPGGRGPGGRWPRAPREEGEWYQGCS